MERSYTVSEIEALRSALETKFLYGSCNPKHDPGVTYMSRSYSETEKVAVVEEWLRTYMLAGVTADDLLD